jgi:hypothetical protein
VQKFKSILNVNHPLFKRLQKDPPQWWINLRNDSDLYIDVRKENYLNVYHNGGSIMKLDGERDYNARIHYEYVPLQVDEVYHKYEFDGGNITLKDVRVLAIDNFGKSALDKIKKRVRHFSPNNSEKGIQGQYVTKNRGQSSKSGFFLDTEFQFQVQVEDGDSNGRIDLVWIDIASKQIVLIELKTIDDARLLGFQYEDPESIDHQLNKYQVFAQANSAELRSHYQRVFEIKKNLGILPSFVKDDSLDGYTVLEKPVLLVGDCTKKWIDTNAQIINKRLQGVGFGCVYHGINTFNFTFPIKTSRNSYRLA